MANYLGVDIGHKRIGLSIGSNDLMMSLPMPALQVHDDVGLFQELANIIKENRVNIIVFGYPLNMDGSVSNMAKYVDNFITKFQKYIPSDIEIVKFDERLTSQQAESERLAIRGDHFESAKRKRNNRNRGVIDSHAAAIILQDYMNELAYRLKSGNERKEGIIEDYT